MTDLDRSALYRLLYLTSNHDADAEARECHVCGRGGKLTYEHVPPKRAYNDFGSLWDRMTKPNGAKDSAYQVCYRSGFVVRTLCADCNNRVCEPYARAYIEFVRSLVDAPHLFDATGRRRLVRVPCDTLLLAKEIATMILAIEPDGYGRHNFGLRRFVLDPDATFKPNFRVLAFLVSELPGAGTITRSHGRVDVFADGYRFIGGEISWFPFGFVYAHEIGRGYFPDDMTDVTHWFLKGNRDDRHGQTVSLNCRVTGVDSIQCGVGRRRVRPQVDYVR